MMAEECFPDVEVDLCTVPKMTPLLILVVSMVSSIIFAQCLIYPPLRFVRSEGNTSEISLC